MRLQWPYAHYHVDVYVLQLLAELRACAPSVLEEQATPVHVVDAGKWLTWYKHKRSFGLSYEQYLQVCAEQMLLVWW
jgi:hypothetical protein